MADQHELKKLYEDIEADEAEMTRFRSHLAARLQRKPSARPSWRWLWVSAPLLAGLAAWAFIGIGRFDLNQRDLHELQSIVATSPNPAELRAKAESLRLDGNELESLNADMVLCLTQPNGGALQAAARGAVNDPRSDFRAFYVEYLLDHADSYQLNLDEIEVVMDREVDVLCLELYDRLLRVARHHGTVTDQAKAFPNSSYLRSWSVV